MDTEEDAYSLISLSDGWSILEDYPGDGILTAYTGYDPTSMEPIAPGQTAEIYGTLMLDVDNYEFASLPDEALDFSVHACGVTTEIEPNMFEPLRVYEYYEEEGGA